MKYLANKITYKNHIIEVYYCYEKKRHSMDTPKCDYETVTYKYFDNQKYDGDKWTLQQVIEQAKEDIDFYSLMYS